MPTTRASTRALRDISNHVNLPQNSYAGKLGKVSTPKRATIAPLPEHDLASAIECIAQLSLSPSIPRSISQGTESANSPEYENMVSELDHAMNGLMLDGLQDYSGKVERTTKALGTGKNGTVYEASVDTGETVAVKTFVLNLSSTSTDLVYFREQLGFLVEEAKMGFKASSRFQSHKKTNICRTLGFVKDVGIDGKISSSIVLERASGMDLLDFMAQKSFWKRANAIQAGGYFIRQEEDDALWEFTMSREEKLCIAVELVSAVEEAHRCGVLHCDLKPENTILDRRSRACDISKLLVDLKLIDFGLSVPVGCGEAVSCGTPGYEAPEAEAFGEVSAKSDVYSLGRTLAELWTGSAIGIGDEEEAGELSELAGQEASSKTARALEFLHWEGEHTKDVEKLLLIDPPVGRLVARCLAEQPEHRPTPPQLHRRLLAILRRHRRCARVLPGPSTARSDGAQV